jgi:hypothetical protein
MWQYRVGRQTRIEALFGTGGRMNMEVRIQIRSLDIHAVGDNDDEELARIQLAPANR